MIKKVRKFEELSDNEKMRAKLKYSNILELNCEDDTEFYLSEEKTRLEDIGFCNVKIMYSGFYSQGDGACFIGEVSPLDLEKEGVKVPESLMCLVDNGAQLFAKIVHEGRYYHSNSIYLYLSIDLCGDQSEGDIDQEDFDHYEWLLQNWCRERSDKIYDRLEEIYRASIREENIEAYLSDDRYFDEDLTMYDPWEVDDDTACFDPSDFEDLLFTSKRLLTYFKDHLLLLAEYACTTASENRKELEGRFYGEKALSPEDQDRVKSICEKYLKEIVDDHDISEAICGVKNVDAN